MRAAREKQEEALAMMQIQNTVANLQQLDTILQKSEKVVHAPFIHVMPTVNSINMLAQKCMLRADSSCSSRS